MARKKINFGRTTIARAQNGPLLNIEMPRKTSWSRAPEGKSDVNEAGWRLARPVATAFEYEAIFANQIPI
jgi:hypothetical protein